MSMLTERKLTLTQAARNAEVNPSTIWRWALRGVRGVRLETFSIGCKRFTTIEALERFIAATTAAANGKSPKARTPQQRERDIERAERELDRAGI